MKLKGLTKLALSGVALAAVAATLGTSTYAWYVTNSTATVGNIQGTAQAGGTGSILVAEAQATGGKNGHGAWAKNIETLNTNNYASTTTASGLIPATPVSAVAGVGTSTLSSTPATSLDSNTKWVNSKGVEIANTEKRFLEFDVWVLSTDTTSVNFSFAIDNTTASTAIKTQIAYTGTGLPSGVTQGQTFAVNIVDALRVGYTQYTYDSTAATSTTALEGTKGASKIFDAAQASSSSVVATGANFAENDGNAHTYYESVLGSNDYILTTGPTLATGSTFSITVEKNIETRLHFYVWLEGTDTCCFDSCNGQSFKLGLQFEAPQTVTQQTQPTQP